MLMENLKIVNCSYKDMKYSALGYVDNLLDSVNDDMKILKNKFNGIKYFVCYHDLSARLYSLVGYTNGKY